LNSQRLIGTGVDRYLCTGINNEISLSRGNTADIFALLTVLGSNELHVTKL